MSTTTISVDVLRSLPLFRNLNETECRQIAEICRVVQFQPGEFVLTYGEISQNLWVLLQGRCEVVRPSNPEDVYGEGLKLNTLEAHSIFGEMSFFHRAPHSANVIAVSPLTLLCIERCDYDDLIRDGAWGAYKLAFNAVEILAERLRRMDKWVADLTQSPPVAPSNGHPAGNGHTSEWSMFRDRLFDHVSL